MNPPGTDLRHLSGRRLPRGRHRLTREEVVGSQRGRMFSAMAQAMAERGYVATSVAEIIRRAGVSRETFYQQFSSKQDCFIQALDAATEVVLTTLADTDADTAGGAPLDRIGSLLGAYFGAILANPSVARALLIEVYAAGNEALERRAAVQDRFVDVAASILDARSAGDRFACQAFVAAVSSMVTALLAAGDLDDLVALRPPLVDLAARTMGLDGT